MTDPSAHDNHLLSYTVDCDRREIALRTVNPWSEEREGVDIVFSGVIAYDFQGDSFGTIFGYLDEAAPAGIHDRHAALFERGRRYAWPGSWNQGRASCLAHFEERRARGWLMSSAIGMTGWVIAQALDVRRR